jgi:hypothetical protein
MYQAPPPPGGSGPIFQLNIDANANLTLRSAASWSKVLGVVGLILAILFIIFGILVQFALRQNAGLGENAMLAGNIGLAVYIIFGLLLLISSIFSINFGSKIRAALLSNDQYSLAAGFAAARNFFAFWAILCIITLLLILLSLFTLLLK